MQLVRKLLPQDKNDGQNYKHQTLNPEWAIPQGNQVGSTEMSAGFDAILKW